VRSWPSGEPDFTLAKPGLIDRGEPLCTYGIGTSYCCGDSSTPKRIALGEAGRSAPLGMSSILRT
jgi:hypothetical protein